jgi:uncharacterized protein YacL
MNSTVRNIVAIVVGLVVGNIINGTLLMVSAYVIPPPSGADVSTMEGLKATMHLFEPKHFLFPFLAHALGTFVAALLATAIAASHHKKFALAIGVLFLFAGIANVVMLPSPLWFTVVDLVFAYIPMSYLGYLVARRKRSEQKMDSM